jgi:hypothetical protein
VRKIFAAVQTFRAVVNVAIRPWTIYLPFAKSIHKFSVEFRLARIRFFLARHEVNWSESLRAIFVAIPKSASSAITDELFRVLGDWKLGDGGFLVAGDLKELFQQIKSSRDNLAGPAVLSIGHQGVSLLTRSGLISEDRIRHIPIVCVSRPDLDRFPSAYSYCRKVGIIPRGIGMEAVLSLLQRKGLPNPDQNDASIDYGPPIHFASSSAWTAPKAGFAPHRIFGMGTLTDCVDYLCLLADVAPGGDTVVRQTNVSRGKPQLGSKLSKRVEKIYGVQGSS